MRIKDRILACSIAGLLALPAAAKANPVLEWNEIAGEAARLSCISPAADPFHESRLYAMTHIAIHDALNAINERFEPYAYDGTPAPAASAAAAVATAAHDTLVAEIPANPDIFPLNCKPDAIARVEEGYAAALAGIPDGPEKSTGIEVGGAAADAILSLRAGDGADTPFLVFDYAPAGLPGEYQFTHGVNFLAAPGWGEVTPFVLQHAHQFRPTAPYSVSCGKPADVDHAGSCKQYAADYEEVRIMGAAGEAHGRSEDQSEVAIFWIESSPLAWNRIGRAVASDRGLDTWEAARLFGLLNMGLADGYIGSMAAKYHYNFWRPVTAIHAGDSDGNPFTTGDDAWEPFDPTPPIPDHDSAHAVEGAVAAEVFRLVFGTDFVTFSACSLSLREVDRRCGETNERRRVFHAFSAAARENGESRILNGYHFRKAVEEGLKHGKKIGALAVSRNMRPAHAAD